MDSTSTRLGRTSSEVSLPSPTSPRITFLGWSDSDSEASLSYMGIKAETFFTVSSSWLFGA